MAKTITFIPNPIADKNISDYDNATIDVAKALKSFQLSMFSFEVMHNDGTLRDLDDLNERQKGLRQAILEKIDNDEPLITPVAGVGINDNFELGAGRDVFMTLAALGWHEIPVHIRHNQFKDLEDFIVTEKA